MAVGAFGDILFRADTFLPKDIKRKASSEWTEHKILNQLPILQRTGGELKVFSCTITFNARYTLNFEDGLSLLEQYAESGEFFPLIIGGDLVGGFDYPNFVVTKCDADYGITDNRGFGLHSTVNVEWKQYRDTVSPPTNPLLDNIGGANLSISFGLNGALGAIASIPGVSAAINGLTDSIGQIVAASPIGGVIDTVNGVMQNVGTTVNGIVSGTISSGLGALQSMAPTGVANAVSLAFGGGIS